MADPAAAEEPGPLARRVMRAADRATLATRRADGWPYASLVEIVTDHDGSPLLLVSDLAEHTRNMRAEPRVSLLFDGTAGLAEPLTGPRVSVLGTAEASGIARHRDRFVARHPGAAAYAGFGDFHVWRVTVERAHLVAGFGRIHWIDRADLLLAGIDALCGHEAGIVAHMNGDHADAVDLYAEALLGRAGGGWRMACIDPDGCDLRRAGETARLAFDAPVRTPQEAREMLVNLARTARAR